MAGNANSGNHRTDYKRGRKPKDPALKVQPQPGTKKQISLRLEMDLFRQLHILALKSRKTVNAVMIEMITETISKAKKGLTP